MLGAYEVLFSVAGGEPRDGPVLKSDQKFPDVGVTIHGPPGMSDPWFQLLL